MAVGYPRQILQVLAVPSATDVELQLKSEDVHEIVVPAAVWRGVQ